ncbi:MAG: hypothetical protein Q8N88_00620 [Nanoarchaeota archaeon]|nr:hypothetical protein [Nanoarchaeota archaeon]
MRNTKVTNMSKIKKAVPLIENKIKVKISFLKDEVKISGSELNEYMVEEIIGAVDFGFEPEDAMLLAKDFVLEFIDIKKHTYRKNLKDVRARLIGTDGKAKRTIENLTGAAIVVKGNNVGVIVDHNHLDSAIQAIELLIQGSKHGNVFSYLEKRGVQIRNTDDEDLGLKEEKKVG